MKTHAALVTTLLALSAAPALAGNVPVVPWDMEYTADTLPEAFVSPMNGVGWTNESQGASPVTVDEGFLSIDTLGQVADWSYWTSAWDTLNDPRIVNAVEFSMRLEAYDGATSLGGAAVWVEDDTHEDILLLTPGQIHLYWSGLSSTAVDPSDGFHVYRIYTRAEDICVTVDGVLVIDGRGQFQAQPGYAENEVGFGDGSWFAASRARWDYLNYISYESDAELCR